MTTGIVGGYLFKWFVRVDSPIGQDVKQQAQL